LLLFVHERHLFPNQELLIDPVDDRVECASIPAAKTAEMIAVAAVAAVELGQTPAGLEECWG